MKSTFVAVAGTFDHLHLGHKKLLATAIASSQASGQKLLIGLCQNSMLKGKKFPQSLQSFSLRHQAVSQFRPDKIIPLSDIYGPAADDPNLKTIVCTNKTFANVQKINLRRRLNRLNPLQIITVPLIKDFSGQILSSTRIRQGLVNRQGLVYASFFQKTLALPESQRPYFQKPFSPPITIIKPSKFNSIAVGDIAAVSLLKAKINPTLAIVDLKTKRQPTFANLSSLGLRPGLTCSNPPSTITPELASKILTCLSQSISTLLVKGEEDLAVLPAILLSPLKTAIYYGQPNQGLVKITVTESTKQKAVNLLKKFR